MIKINALKTVAFIVRFLLILLTLPVVIVFFPSLGRKDIVDYLPLFIFSFVLIFPFRLLKSAVHLKIYLFLLFFVSINLLVNVIFKTNWQRLTNDFIYSLILVFNYYFVYLYYRHRLNPKSVNPFIEKRKFEFFLKPFRILKLRYWLLLFLGSILLFSYLFVDVEVRKSSVSFPLPWPLPHARVFQFKEIIYEKDFTVSASGSHLKAAGSLYFTVPMKDKSFFEIYDNDKLAIRVEKLSEEVNGSRFEYKVYEKNGKEVKTDNSNRVINGDLDIYFVMGGWKSYVKEESKLKKVITKEDIVVDKDGFAIDLSKKVSVPKKPGFIPLPFIRTLVPWKVTVKTDKGEVVVNRYIQLWY
ncbi:MAG: hypothetical protein HYW86_05405 [Candidatus Roizmanbacteria bacterium]|nr:MAG: hypothetical protein HYW86_05405 [Candidatus Roizmanbacteria bacterium]